MLFTAQGKQAHLEASLEDLGSLKNILTICDEYNPAPICFILFNGKWHSVAFPETRDFFFLPWIMKLRDGRCQEVTHPIYFNSRNTFSNMVWTQRPESQTLYYSTWYHKPQNKLSFPTGKGSRKSTSVRGREVDTCCELLSSGPRLVFFLFSGVFGTCEEEEDRLNPSLLSLWTSLVDSLRLTPPQIRITWSNCKSFSRINSKYYIPL